MVFVQLSNQKSLQGLVVVMELMLEKFAISESGNLSLEGILVRLMKNVTTASSKSMQHS